MVSLCKKRAAVREIRDARTQEKKAKVPAQARARVAPVLDFDFHRIWGRGGSAGAKGKPVGKFSNTTQPENARRFPRPYKV